MSTEAELFAAVLAAPDDDAHRLVLADFLTGQGDPRGEFITLQCRLAAAPDDEARRKLRIAENKLLKAHEADWSADFLEVAHSTPDRRVKVAFHRGFLEEATLPLLALDVLPALFERAPLLRRLRFDSPFFGTGQPMTPPTLARRLNAPQLQAVRALDLRIPAAGDAAAVELAQAKHLKGLRSLKLEASSWPVPQLPQPLFTGPPETHLLTATGAHALAHARQFAQLEELTLSGNALGSAGVQALLEGAWRLKSLAVANTALTRDGLHAIATSSALTRLESLSIGGGSYDAGALGALASSKHLGELHTLDLTGAPFLPDALERFFSQLSLPKLRHLVLESTALGDQGAKLLAKSPKAAQLRSLELGSNKLTQDGVFALADSPHLANLERLLLNDAWLGKKAVIERLATSPTLANCRIYVKGTLLGREVKKTAAAEKAAKQKPPSPKKKK